MKQNLLQTIKVMGQDDKTELDWPKAMVKYTKVNFTFSFNSFDEIVFYMF